MMKDKGSILSFWQLCGFIVPLALYESMEMFASEDIATDYTNYALLSSTTIPILMFSFIAVVFCALLPRINHTHFTRSYLVTFAYIYFISLALSMQTPFGARQTYITLFTPILLFIYGYKCCQTINENLIVNIFCACAAFLLMVFYFTWKIDAFSKIHTMGGYTILMFLPFVLMHKNRIVKIIFIICSFAALMVALKRGGVVAFILALFAYLFVKYIHRGSHIRNLAALCAVGILLLVLFFAANNFFADGKMITRLMSIPQDKGSNRIPLYLTTIDLIRNSNLNEYLWGHGWNSLISNNLLFMSAHNDGLELLYDCGLFALLLYAILIINIVRFAIRLTKSGSSYAAPFAASITIFMVNSSISHVVLYPKFMIIFALTWGIVAAGANKERQLIES